MSANDTGRTGSDADFVPHQRGEPVKSLSPGLTFWYTLANLGYGAFYAFNSATLPLFLDRYTQDARIIALMGSSHSFEGAIIQPVVGSLSDRLRTRWGRRRPFMLLFAPLSAAFLILTPMVRHFAEQYWLPAMLAYIFLFTVFFNMAQDPYRALMADITPPEQRGRITGFWTVAGILGQIAIVLLLIRPTYKFSVVAAMMVLTTLLTCVKIREPEHPGGGEEKEPHLAALREAVRGLRTLRQARKALTALFFAGLGIGAIFPLLTKFVKVITGCTPHQAEMMFFLLMLGTIAGVLPFGWLADRIRPKRVLMIGLGMVATASFFGLWVMTLPQISVLMIVAGLGNAALSASSYPLLLAIVPAEEVGFYTGLQTTALSIAMPLTAVVTGALVNRGGFRMIFLVCAVALLAAMASLSLVRLRKSVDEIEQRKRELGRIAA